MHYVPIGQKTSANILTEWLDLESGLLCFDRVSISRKSYSAFLNVELFIYLTKCGFGQEIY